MNILVTGASGYIGQDIIKRLIHTEHDLTACINKTELPFNVKILKFDFSQMLKITDWFPYLVGIDIVINCVGIIAENRKQSFDVVHSKAPKALFKACEKKVKRVIQISALGADDSAIVSYHKSKKQADDYLRSSRLEWFVLRPSLVYGAGGKSFSFFQNLSNYPIIPLVGNGAQLVQPVHIGVLIKTIEKCLQSTNINQTIDVVGKQAISYKNWMVILRQKQSKPKFIMFSMGLMIIISKLLRPFNFQLISEDNLIMLQQNNVSDYSPLKLFLENES